VVVEKIVLHTMSPLTTNDLCLWAHCEIDLMDLS